MLNDPISIVVCYAYALIEFWAGLFAEGDKEALVAGANTMLAIALKILSKRKRAGDQKLLKDGATDDATE
jgi:hypothetical protein